MPAYRPTLIQARILRHLRKAEEEGRTPSYRELAEAFDWKAVATVRDHVMALKAKGLVTLAPHQARSLRLTEAGRAAAVAATKQNGAGEAPQASLTAAGQEVMDLLAPWLQPKSYVKGAILWHEGDRADRLVIVDAGRLRAFRQLADGRTATVLQFGSGEVLGFAPFFDEGGYPATVETLEAVKIRYVVRQELLRAMREPRVAMALIGLLARRLRKAFDTIEQLSLHRALPRVAAALQALVKGEDYRLLTLPHSSKAFAEALGLAPATLSRALAQLTRLGILHRLGPRRYQVLLAEELARLSEGDDGQNALR
jgi:CRP/FNR family transcriptional regulator